MANYDLTYEGSRVQGILDTGDELRDAGYIFRGEATPSTVPGTPTERVAYIGGPGTYTNFGSSITVPVGRICVFKYTGSAWSNQVIDTKVSDGAAYKGIATPTTNPGSPIGSEFYIAVQAGTYTNFGSLAVTDGINILKYNGSTWSVQQAIGIDAEPTQGSANLVKSGGVLGSIIQNGPAFDLSAYNAQGGVLATYADLSAALTALNALPSDFKKGGMSIKFVLSSDNNYIQARLMANSFTTDITKWQGIDAEPTAGSKNLIESGGVNISYKVNAVSGSNFIYDLPIKFKQGQKYSFIVSCDTADVFQGNTIALCKTDNTGVADLVVNGGYAIYTHELADDTPLRLYRYMSNVLANAVVEVEIDKNYHAGEKINALTTNVASLNISVSDNTAEIARINDRTGLLLEKNSANGIVFTNSDVAVGDTVYLTFKLDTSGIGAIGYFNSNDERIANYGLSTSFASPNAKVSYKTIIPQGFAYAKVQWHAITNVFVEKQLIQEKDLQGQIDIIASTTSTGAISAVQGQTLDYLTDIVLEQGKKYSIALKSSVDGIIDGDYLVLHEKLNNPTVNVSIPINGEHVIYTHSIYNTKMHLYRYGSNVLASGSIKLEIKRDVFDSEDIDAIKSNVEELQSFNEVRQFNTTIGSDFNPQIPFSFKKGTTYAIRLISPIAEIIKGNKVNLTDNIDSPAVSEVYINGNALIYTHTLDTPTMYLSRYRTNVLATGIIEMSIQKEYVTDKTINELQDKEIQLKAIAEYNAADYDRINSQDKVLLLGSERTSFKNKTNVNACSGSYNKIKFAICTDIHVNANENQKYHWWNPDTGQFDFTGIERAFGYMDSRKYDFLISLGDNLNDGYMGTYNLMVSELNSLDTMLKNKATDTLFFFLSGNHDTHLNVPRFTGNGIFSVRGVNFISFYATYIGISQNPTVAGGSVSDETLQWLDDVLTEHEGEINIVMCHFPLGDGNLNYAILDSYTTAGGETGDGHRDDVIQLLESHNVHLYLSGHCHAQTWPVYQLGTNLKEINCGSLTSNVNTILLGGSFALAEVDMTTKKFNGVVYGVDTLEPRTHEIISGNNDPISDLTNIDV